MPEAGRQVVDTLPSTMSLALAANVATAPAALVASRVRVPGTLTVGGVVSRTVTLKLALPVLPCASVAEQVTSVAPRAKVEPEAGRQVVDTLPSTMSLAVAVKLAAAPEGPVASFEMSLGTVTMGGVVSWTITLNEALPVLPCASVAEQVTDVVPMAKVEPEAGRQVVATLPSTMSLAVAVKVATAPAAPAASLVMSDGTLTIGGVVSVTITLKLALPVLPCASVAEQVTGLVPMAKVEPEAGRQVVATLPSTMSLADAVKLAAAPEGPVASFEMSLGTVTMGGVVSWTITLNEALPVLPCASVAVQETGLLPIAKVEPEVGAQLVATLPSTMSLALVVKPTVAPAALVASAVMSPGTATVGGVVSTTCTVKDFDALLLCASATLQVTRVSPSGKFEPEAGTQEVDRMPSTASVAMGLR